jgi:hypothetical protein
VKGAGGFEDLSFGEDVKDGFMDALPLLLFLGGMILSSRNQNAHVPEIHVGSLIERARQ